MTIGSRPRVSRAVHCKGSYTNWLAVSFCGVSCGVCSGGAFVGRSVGEESCRQVLEKSVVGVEKCWRREGM